MTDFAQTGGCPSKGNMQMETARAFTGTEMEKVLAKTAKQVKRPVPLLMTRPLTGETRAGAVAKTYRGCGNGST
jgi:hypothetical protein